MITEISNSLPQRARGSNIQYHTYNTNRGQQQHEELGGSLYGEDNYDNQDGIDEIDADTPVFGYEYPGQAGNRGQGDGRGSEYLLTILVDSMATHYKEIDGAPEIRGTFVKHPGHKLSSS